MELITSYKFSRCAIGGMQSSNWPRGSGLVDALGEQYLVLCIYLSATCMCVCVVCVQLNHLAHLMLARMAVLHSWPPGKVGHLPTIFSLDYSGIIIS